MRPLRGVVQHYAWGDPVAIPRILGQAADGRPWAEWWLGTHPGGPAVVVGGQPLVEVAGELPFLLKLLAAQQPLSLQVHPDTATAAAGFARENAAGIAERDPRRVYRDASAKPEMVCALSPFEALCGFRPLGDTEALLHSIGADELAVHLRQSGLEAAITGLYRRHIDAAPVVRACAGHPTPHAELVTRLDRLYPGDPSVVVTLFLNRVLLQPGEALFLGPGTLHAYLHGVGVEVMGASDNVVRGGLTAKHVDIDELLRVLQFEPLADPVVRATEMSPDRWRYHAPGAPFVLDRLDVSGALPYTAPSRALLLCTDGDAGPLHHGEAAYLAPGESVVLEGPSTVFAVAEP